MHWVYSFNLNLETWLVFCVLSTLWNLDFILRLYVQVLFVGFVWDDLDDKQPSKQHQSNEIVALNARLNLCSE